MASEIITIDDFLNVPNRFFGGGAGEYVDKEAVGKWNSNLVTGIQMIIATIHHFSLCVSVYIYFNMPSRSLVLSSALPISY